MASFHVKMGLPVLSLSGYPFRAYFGREPLGVKQCPSYQTTNGV